jgi:hypothetical protein
VICSHGLDQRHRQAGKRLNLTRAPAQAHIMRLL